MSNIYIGSKYNQICDSKGPHNTALLTDLGDGTTRVQWLATARTNSSGYAEKWGGPFSWDNLYCWVSCTLPDVLPNPLKLELIVDVKFVDLSNINTLEFESQAVTNKRLYNMAWQFQQQAPLHASTFDYKFKEWIVAFSLTVPVLTVNKQARFCALYSMTDTGPQYLGVQYNNLFTPVNVSRPWVSSLEKNYINFAFQFDSLNKGTAIDAVVSTRLVVND